jgi:carbon monoxide dehydrogenase subunit G
MANDFTVTIDIAAPPAAVWDVVGDPCGVTLWYPLYESCVVEGETRTLRRADGAELVERLLERDDERRFYSYSVLSGAPLRSHEASFEVLEAAGGSRVAWRTRGEPSDPAADLEQRLADRQRDALGGLKALLEAPPAGA